MEREHLIDLAADRRPQLGGSAMFLGALLKAEERLEARQYARQHADGSNGDLPARGNLLLERCEHTGSHDGR